MTMNPWVALLILFFGRMTLGFQFQSVVSVAPELIDAFKVDYADIGTLAGLFTLPGLIFSLIAGVIGKRYGNKAAVSGGLALMVSGSVCMAVAPSFLILSLGRLQCGIGAIVLFVLLTKMVADWFVGKNLSKAMSVIINGWPIGIGAGLLTHHLIAEAFSFQAVFWVNAAFAGTVLIAMLGLYRNPSLASADSPSQTSRISQKEVFQVSTAALGLTFYNAAVVLVLSFLPAHFIANNVAPTIAGSLVNLHILVSITGVITGGVLAAGKYKMVSSAGALVACSAMLLYLVFGSINGLLFIFMGFVIGIPAALLMTLPVTVLQPGNRDVGFGILYTWVYGGLAVVMFLAGYLREIYNTPSAPVYLAAALLALTPVMTWIFLLLIRRRSASAPIGSVA